ncbi:TPA: plasmid stabilization protein [Escherichia coli]|nr:plasmid stabilization protein [Escherichia coli]
MNSTTHYENANFLRELAESLPRIFPEGSTDKSALLQRLANEELARAEYDEQIRAKVAAARADKRPGMSSAQLRQQLQGRYQELRNELTYRKLKNQSIPLSTPYAT